jgi:hypothetical protein
MLLPKLVIPLTGTSRSIDLSFDHTLQSPLFGGGFVVSRHSASAAERSGTTVSVIPDNERSETKRSVIRDPLP